jgi:hypothetical protein
MTVESVTYISDLNATYPASGDARSEGDDHLRNIKAAVKATFPNITGAVTPTHTELNYVDGVTSAIQTQLDAKAAPADLGLHFISGGTVTAAATLDITSGIDGTYDEYEFHIIHAVPATNNVIATLRTSADAGSTWNSTAADYDWVLNWSNQTTATVSNGSTGATRIELTDNTMSSATANGGYSGVIRVFDPADTTFNKRVQWHGSGSRGTASVQAMGIGSGSGQRTSAVAINGLRFMFSSGNIATAKWKLYGVRKS